MLNFVSIKILKIKPCFRVARIINENVLNSIVVHNTWNEQEEQLQSNCSALFQEQMCWLVNYTFDHTYGENQSNTLAPIISYFSQ